MKDESNYRYYRYKYINGPFLHLTVPVDISLELSSLCNMHCNYCYHADKKNLPFKQNKMSWKTANEIILQAADLGVNSIKFNWRGESTMNDNFFVICKTAKLLATDSTFIDRLSNSNFKFDNNRKDIFEALACQTKVKISYDSFKKSIFEEQRAGGDHDLTTANIDTFYNMPGRETEIVIQAVRTQANKDEDFEAEIKKKWPSAKLSVRDVAPGRSEKDYDALLVKEQSKERKSCLQAHARLIFDHTGTPTVCCPDIKMELANLGNIHTTSMADMFNHKFVKKLRADLKSGEAFKTMPSCKNCSSHETYKDFVPNWES